MNQPPNPANPDRNKIMKVAPSDCVFPCTDAEGRHSAENKSVQCDVPLRLGEPVCEAEHFHCVLPHAASSGKPMKRGTWLYNGEKSVQS